MDPITLVNDQGQEFVTDSPSELVQFRNQGFREKSESAHSDRSTTAKRPSAPKQPSAQPSAPAGDTTAPPAGQ